MDSTTQTGAKHLTQLEPSEAVARQETANGDFAEPVGSCGDTRINDEQARL